MARKINILLLDDIDGSPADRTVAYAYDGVQYEIDLSEGNDARLRKALEPFIAASRRTGGRQGAAGKKGGRSKKRDASVVRAWAVEKGMEVTARGRIPQAVQDAYDEAHS